MTFNQFVKANGYYTKAELQEQYAGYPEFDLESTWQETREEYISYCKENKINQLWY